MSITSHISYFEYSVFINYYPKGGSDMYWDTLTATGLFISIVWALGGFYLELRQRPVVPRRDLQNS